MHKARAETPVRDSNKEYNFAETVRFLDEKCQECTVVTPLQCVSGCNIWKVKNEIKYLRAKMEKPDFIKNLVNALKNATRMHMLKMVAERALPLETLQFELKKKGRHYSLTTISTEYLEPLVELGLALQELNEYSASILGKRIDEVIQGDEEELKLLPINSRGYEELILGFLLEGPKTFQEICEVLPKASVSRVLKRLKTARLLESPKEKDYVFYFRTKRKLINEELSPSEARIYQCIPWEGISVKMIAQRTGSSVRMVYKFLRKLRGKKLVFTRKQSKTYKLTCKGQKAALMLHRIRNLISEIVDTTQSIAQNN